MQRSTRTRRSYTSGRFALEIDGVFAGFIKKASGGTIKGEVVTQDLGISNVQKKHLASITHEPLNIEVDFSMGKPLWDWIQASFDKGYVSKSSVIVAADFNYKAVANRELQDAVITEFSLPALDAGSKEPSYFTLEVTPKTIRYSKGGGEQLKSSMPAPRELWLSSSFRVELGDLPCQRIVKVDSFTWKQRLSEDKVNQFRDPENIPAAIEVPNLKLTISMADLEQWQEWHKSFVIDGKCTDGDEISGSIEFLTPDLKKTLASIDLAHVGIISLDPYTQKADGGTFDTFDVELYVEEMKFSYQG